MNEKKPSRRAAKVWQRLTQWYGARLADTYGPVCPPDWCEVVDRTDDHRIETALATIKREHLHHPPTLGEFEAAIPRRKVGEAKSPASILVEHALRARQLCGHQRAAQWSYFGPVVDFPPRKGRAESVSHAELRGVVIPACKACGRSSHRITLEQAERGEDAA